MNEDKVLQAIANLTVTMERGFSDMSARFEAIEDRLGQQERKSRKTAQRQTLQESEIRKLKEIVQRLAASEPCWSQGNTAAIRKEAAYNGEIDDDLPYVGELHYDEESGMIYDEDGDVVDEKTLEGFMEGDGKGDDDDD